MGNLQNNLNFTRSVYYMLNNHLIATTDLQKTIELLRQVFILYVQGTHKNRQILPLLCVGVQIMLAKASQMMNNNRTTNQIAVLPNRHTMAFFMPYAPNSVTGINTPSDTSPKTVKTANLGVLSSVDGGLIVQNTIPFTGNMYSRLFAVVETRQPFLWLAKLTKQIGASKMNANTIKNRLLALPTIKANTLTKTQIIDYINHASPIVLVAIGFVLGLPLACLVIAVLFAMGV